MSWMDDGALLDARQALDIAVDTCMRF